MRVLIASRDYRVLAELDDPDLVRQMCRAAVIRDPGCGAALLLTGLEEWRHRPHATAAGS